EDPGRLKLNYNLSLTLHEPLLFSRKSMGSASLFTERHTEFQAFLREAMGTELAVTRQLSDYVPARLAYSASWGRTLASDAIFCVRLNVCDFADTKFFEGRRFRSALSFQLSRDGTNSILDATRGSAASIELKYSPSFLGSDSLMQFSKATLKFETHREIGLKSVVSARFEIGRMLTRVVTFASGPVRYAPPEERFYLGGANSVRGFAPNQLGPIVRVETPTGTIVSAIGGNSMVMASLEGRFPIPLAFKGLFGALFIDAGQVG